MRALLLLSLAALCLAAAVYGSLSGYASLALWVLGGIAFGRAFARPDDDSPQA
jgi:hypothetical protein